MEIEQELLDLHNAYRSKHKLEELVLDDDLCVLAQKHSDFMHKKNRLSHEGFQDRMKKLNRAMAENVGFSPSATACFKMWTNSKGHDANIRGRYTKVGFGRNGNYWTTLFS